MKNILKLTIFFTLICFQFLRAETIIVTPDDFLAGVVRNASGGDIILMQPGTYSALYLDDLIFTKEEPLIIRGDGTGEVMIEGSLDSGYYNGVKFENCSYIVLEGVTISTFNVGVRTIDCDHIIFNDLEVENIGYGAIHTYYSNYIDILNCKIHDTGVVEPKWGEGIYIGSGGYSSDYSDFPNNCEHIWIEGNEIWECGKGEGVNIKGESFHVTVKNNIIHDIHPGTSDQSNKGGITIEAPTISILQNYRIGESRDVWVEDNYVYDIYDGFEDYWNNGIKIHTSGVYVLNNTIENCVNSGIFYNIWGDFGIDAYINGNTISNCAVEMDISNGLTYYDEDPGSNPNEPQKWYGYPDVPLEGISLNKTETTIDTEGLEKLLVSFLPADATNTSVEWSSSDTNIATVDEEGLITAVNNGVTEITVTSAGEDNNFFATCIVTVMDLPDFSVTILQPANGSIELSRSGGMYPQGTLIEATAIPKDGYLFEAWQEDFSGTENPLSITVMNDVTISAAFIEEPEICDIPDPIDLPFIQEGAGEYCFITEGKVEKLNSWNMDYLEINGQDFTNNFSRTIPESDNGKIYIYYVATKEFAHFEIYGQGIVEENYYSLSTSVEGLGTIVQNPEEDLYLENSEVTLTAIPDDGYQFAYWNNDPSLTEASIVVVMDADKQYTAIYTEISNETFVVDTSVSGNGSIVLNPDGGIYQAGTVIEITALPDNGHQFDNWFGDVSGNTNLLSITINKNTSIEAVFSEIVDVEFCDTPEMIAIPFVKEGIGDFCYETTDELVSINSWNLIELTINGEDYTNQWSNDIPEKIDGKYTINYRADVPWSHFETNGVSQKSFSTDLMIKASPNPFKTVFTLVLEYPESIEEIKVFDIVGKTIERVLPDAIYPETKIGEGYTNGVYFIQVKRELGYQILKVIKE
ncbi:InlB B-repeat-containing protein [Aquimarina pacifica]|uniref:InlB B-repeat-containing protein n=1 Tax=Aquimarina pacifica TaxID=1296415 RepID=UPI000470116D|nr:Ig-like domain-containing protein [Aquimarina pacifica]